MPIFAPLSSGGDDRQVSRTSSERPSKRPRTAKSPTDTGSTAVLNTSVPQQPARLAIPHAPPTRPLPAQQQPKSKSRTKKAPKSTAGAAAAPSKPALPPPEPPVKKTDEELMAEEVHWEVDYIVAKRGSVLKGNRQFLVKWSGYGSDDNSWLEEDDVAPDLIESFLKGEMAEMKAKADKARAEAEEKAQARIRAATDARLTAQAENAAAQRARARTKARQGHKAEGKSGETSQRPKDRATGRGATSIGATPFRGGAPAIALRCSAPAGRKNVEIVIDSDWPLDVQKRVWMYNMLRRPNAPAVKGSDDHCTVCLDGGALFCCDACPRAFHRKCVEREATAAGLSPSEVRPTDADGPWFCLHCVELSHEQACVVTGYSGDDRGHLIPCASCPRSFHPAALESGSSEDTPPRVQYVDGQWQCSHCQSAGSAARPASTGGEHSALAEAAAALAKLPTTHWGSILGTRIQACVDNERALEDAGQTTVCLADSCANLQDTQRLFALSLNRDRQGGRSDRSAAAAAASSSALDGSSPSLVHRFHVDGFVAPTNSNYDVPSAQVSLALELIMGQFRQTMHTIHQLDLHDDLAIGFKTFKARGKNRYDMIVPDLDTFPELGDNAPWLPLIKSILGDDVRRLSTSCILSLRGSDFQQWHSDGEHIASGMHLPPHCLNVFIPLVDMTEDLGPTQFIPGSHIHYNTDVVGVAPVLPAGRPLLFDHRVKHRGVANKSSASPRPLLYITYAKAWFQEPNNVGIRKRGGSYLTLPELIPIPSRRGDDE